MVKDTAFIKEQNIKLEQGWEMLQTKLLLQNSPDNDDSNNNPFQLLEDGKPNSACSALCAIAGAIIVDAENRGYGSGVQPFITDDLPEDLVTLCVNITGCHQWENLSSRYINIRKHCQHYRMSPVGEFILKIYKYKETRMLY